MSKAIGRRGIIGGIGAGLGTAFVGRSAAAAGTATPVRARPSAARLTSVLDYGATGDGSTDDTDAINRALAAGGAVYLPAGTYLVSDLNATVEGTWIRGDGPSTILQKTGG